MRLFCWISSYPRSGNRLLSQIIHLICNSKGKFRDTVPDFHQNSLNKNHKFCKIHRLYENLPFKECKIIYLLRNPLDILASSINYIENFQKKRLPEDFVNKFCNNRGYIEEWIEFGSYYEHVSQYLLNKEINCKNILTIQFENLVTNKYMEIGRIASFLKIDVSPDIIDTIMEQTSFQEVKLREPKNLLLYNGKVNENSLILDDDCKKKIIRLYSKIINEINSFSGINLKNFLNEN